MIARGQQAQSVGLGGEFHPVGRDPEHPNNQEQDVGERHREGKRRRRRVETP